MTDVATTRLLGLSNVYDTKYAPEVTKRIGDTRATLPAQLDSVELSTKKGIKKGFGLIASCHDKMDELGKKGVRSLYSLQNQCKDMIDSRWAKQRSRSIKEIISIGRNSSAQQIDASLFANKRWIPDSCKSQAAALCNARNDYRVARKAAKGSNNETKLNDLKSKRQAYKKAKSAYEQAYDSILLNDGKYGELCKHIEATEKYAKDNKIKLPERAAGETGKKAGEKASKGVGENIGKSAEKGDSVWKNMHWVGKAGIITAGVLGLGLVGAWLFGGKSQQAQQ